MPEKMPFPVFMTMWNQDQGMTTPRVHVRIASWLGARLAGGDDRILLMAFRACGKSTIIGLFCAWCLVNNPDLRILVVSADDHLAMRMVRNVRRVIERHPACANLVPQRADQWAADRFTVRRDAELRDPSMTACGVFGNYTGMRADMIICDDVEVPATSSTQEARDGLRSRLAELSYVRAPGGRMVYAGTPHAFDTIYAENMRGDIPGHRAFLAGYKALRVPVRDESGTIAWPEKYTEDMLDSMCVETGMAAFSSQMMLKPVSALAMRLDPADLVMYRHEMIWVPELSHLYIGDTRMVSCSAWWDPAFGHAGGDASVLAVVYTDAKGHLWLHHIRYIAVDPHHHDDAARQQCAQVAKILRDLRVPVIGIETNGIGKFLPAILRQEIVKARTPCAVREMNARTAKNERILRAFETPMAARMLHVHEDIAKTPFIGEMRDWSPGRIQAKDDGLDAAAGAILMEPVRIPSLGPGAARPSWRG